MKENPNGYFSLLQIENESFWQHLSRLNDYHAHYKHFKSKKWKICNFELEGITHETPTTLESICYNRMCYLNVDYIWDLFESLTWYQQRFESANESFMFPSSLPYGLYAQSLCVDQLRDLCHHHPSYAHVLCSYCQSFDHDVNYYPYYDVFNESFARFNAMIKTMNEWNKHFISEIKECGLPVTRTKIIDICCNLSCGLPHGVK